MKSNNEILSDLPSKFHRYLEDNNTKTDESIHRKELAEIARQVHGDKNLTRIPFNGEETNSHPKLRALEEEQGNKRHK